MKLILTVLMLMISLNVSAAEYSDEIKELSWDDPIWYSSDGEKWYSANFLMHIESPDCKAAGHSEDCFPLPTDCSGTKEQVAVIWYDKPEHPDGMELAYLSATDPAVNPPPSKDELYGLLTRIENLLTADSIKSFLGTLLGLMRDKDELLERSEALREKLKAKQSTIAQRGSL